jgi:hypothetical protein
MCNSSRIKDPTHGKVEAIVKRVTLVSVILEGTDLNLLKSLLEGDWGRKDKNGGMNQLRL